MQRGIELETALDTVIEGDCVDVMNALPEACADLMFADPPSPRTEPANFSALRNSKTVLIARDEYDVFGDKAVVIKAAPGHSPGHQVLFLKLPKTGPALLQLASVAP